MRQAVPNLSKTGSHGEPHALPAPHWSLQETSFFPVGMWQTPSLQCNSADCAIYATTPYALHPGRSLVQTLLWLLTVRQELRCSPDHLLSTPAPTTRCAPSLPHQLKDRFSPFSSERHPMLRHCGRPPSCAPSRQWPTECHRRWSDHRQRFPIAWHQWRTFVDTRQPPSLHTCAAARSNANPLAPKTPASAHAAQWWPQ